MKRAIVTTLIALIAGAALVLASCGGGCYDTCDAGADAPTPRVDCQAIGVCK